MCRREGDNCHVPRVDGGDMWRQHRHRRGAVVVSGGSHNVAKQPLLLCLGTQFSCRAYLRNLGTSLSLTTLDLSYLGGYPGLTMGGLVGSIPSELGSCTNLVTLRLHCNALSGSLPDSLSRLQRLTLLQLGYNLFDAPFPTVLTTLASLAYLSIMYNGFSGPIPEGISNLKSLTSLILHMTPVSGGLPPNLGSLQNLQSLSVGFNPSITGPLPSTLSGLSQSPVPPLLHYEPLRPSATNLLVV